MAAHRPPGPRRRTQREVRVFIVGQRALNSGSAPPRADDVHAMVALPVAPGLPHGTGGAETWARHGEPPGLTLLAPASWQVMAMNAHELTAMQPQQVAAALVRARQVSLQHELADWLWQHYPATEPGLHNVRMLRIETLPAQAACAVFDYGSQVVRGRASALALRDGRHATVFVAASVRARHAELLPVLIRILASCRPAPPGISAAARRALLARLLRLGAEALDA
jgi:hypothetical protein